MLGKSAVWHQFSPCLPMLMSSMQMNRPGLGPACLLYRTARKHAGVALLPLESLLCVVSDGFFERLMFFPCQVLSVYSCFFLAVDVTTVSLPNILFSSPCEITF